MALYRVEGDVATAIASSDAGVSLEPVHGVALDQLLTHDPEDESRKAWLRRVGQALYERLSPGDIGTRLMEIAGASVTLEMEARALARAPWELCRRPDMVTPIFADPEVPWLCGSQGQGRGLGQPEGAGVDARMVAAEWPLRVLVVVGSAPDDKRVQALDEVYALEALARGFRDVVTGELDDTPGDASTGEDDAGSLPTRCDVLLETLFQPDLDDLKRTLYEFRPHVFHFVGHGRVKEGEPELLVFSRTDGVNHPWGYDQIGAAFHPRAVPRLVYLDACHSAVDQPDAWSLTQAFRDIGVGAIVAMQREIQGSNAVDIAREFYAHAFSSQSLEGAMARVRRSLIAKGRDEWYVPRLWVRGDPDRLRPTPNPSTDVRADLARCPPIESAPCFVDRWPQRREVWQSQGAARDAGLLLLEGASKTGKTSFVQWLLEFHALAGRSLCYVDMRDARGDYLAVLDRIAARQTGDDPGADGAAPEGPDDADPDAPAAGPFAAYHGFLRARDVRRHPERAGHYRERLMRLFWDGLRAITAERELFLVLDHLQPGPFSDEVVAREIAYDFLHAYRPPDTRAQVRALLVVTKDQADAVRRQRFETPPPSVEVRSFSDFERDHYMPLYFAWRSRELPRLARDEGLAKQVQDIIVKGDLPCPEAFEAVEPFLLMMARESSG